jgi:hypothetical protein
MVERKDALRSLSLEPKQFSPKISTEGPKEIPALIYR